MSQKKKGIFVFLPNHDGDRYHSAARLGNKLLLCEGEPTSFLRVYCTLTFQGCKIEAHFPERRRILLKMTFAFPQCIEVVYLMRWLKDIPFSSMTIRLAWRWLQCCRLLNVQFHSTREDMRGGVGLTGQVPLDVNSKSCRKERKKHNGVHVVQGFEAHTPYQDKCQRFFKHGASAWLMQPIALCIS